MLQTNMVYLNQMWFHTIGILDLRIYETIIQGALPLALIPSGLSGGRSPRDSQTETERRRETRWRQGARERQRGERERKRLESCLELA